MLSYFHPVSALLDDGGSPEIGKLDLNKLNKWRVVLRFCIRPLHGAIVLRAITDRAEVVDDETMPSHISKVNPIGTPFLPHAPVPCTTDF